MVGPAIMLAYFGVGISFPGELAEAEADLGGPPKSMRVKRPMTKAKIISGFLRGLFGVAA